MEEALKCEGLAAVIGEIKEISFSDSRRLQLAVEQPGNRLSASSTAAHAEYYCCCGALRISLPSHPEDELPGLVFHDGTLNY
jgi:protein ImuA